MLVLLGCDPQTSGENTSVENPEVHLPISFAVGDTYLYRILATTTRGVSFFPPTSNTKAKESTTEFGLILNVASLEDDGVILTVHVNYIATQAKVGPMLFSIDTRQSNTQMNDMSVGDYQIVHLGLEDLDHPINTTWRVLKAITEKPFQIRLDRDGGFMALEGYAPEAEDVDGLNLLAPGRLAMMLCLMLPPHQPEIVTAGAQWIGQCNGQPTSFEISHASSNQAIYVSTLSYQQDDTFYAGEIRGNMSDMLASGEIHLGQSHRQERYVSGLGNLVTTSTVDVTGQIEQQMR